MKGNPMPRLSRLRNAARAFDDSRFSPRQIGEWAHNRLIARREAAAQSDPEWQALQAKRREPEGNAFATEIMPGLDERMRQLDIETRLVPADPITQILMKLSRVQTLKVVSRAETLGSRARHGWAPEDVWGLDHHVCRVIGDMLIYASENSHGWPKSDEFPTSEDWYTALRTHGKAIREMHYDDDARMEKARASMHWVADHLADFWD